MAVIDNAQEFAPDYAVPPGETLVELLEERYLSQAELARHTDLSAKHINQIIKGHAPNSSDVAFRFERVTGVPGLLWPNLENRYQERLARLQTTGLWRRTWPCSTSRPLELRQRWSSRTESVPEPTRYACG